MTVRTLVRADSTPLTRPYIRNLVDIELSTLSTGGCGQGVVLGAVTVGSPGVHQSVPRSSPCNSVAVHRNDNSGIQMRPGTTPVVHRVHSTYYCY